MMWAGVWRQVQVYAVDLVSLLRTRKVVNQSASADKGDEIMKWWVVAGVLVGVRLN